MTVGEIIAFGPHGMPVVKDWLQNREVCVIGGLPYNRQLALAFAKLDPFERYSLLAVQSCKSASACIFDKQKYNFEPLLSYAEIEAKLL